jgi:hypothetical protein
VDNPFTLMSTYLVEYVFGSYLVFGLVLFFAMIILLLAARISPVLSFVLSVPFFMTMISAGWFGEIDWIKNLILLLMAIIWGSVLWRLIN